MKKTPLYQQLDYGLNFINISNITPFTKVHGPKDRMSIWVQGCLQNCPGCINPQTHSMEVNELYKVSDLVTGINNTRNHIQGITWQGGEPFLQASAIANIIKQTKELNLSQIMFTGYTLSFLKKQNNQDINYLLKNIDVLIDGQFKIELLDKNLIRGSNNQRIHFLNNNKFQFTENDFQKKGTEETFTFTNDSIQVQTTGIN